MNMNFRATVRQSNRQGFTLTEVAIVLGIMGLILGSIWSAYASVSHAKRADDLSREFNTAIQNIQTFYYNNPANAPNDDVISLANAGVFPLDLVPMPPVTDTDGEVLTSQGYGFSTYASAPTYNYNNGSGFSYSYGTTIGNNANAIVYAMYVYQDNDSYSFSSNGNTTSYNYNTGSQPMYQDICMRVVMDVANRPDVVAIYGPNLSWYKVPQTFSFNENDYGTPYSSNSTQPASPPLTVATAASLCQDITYNYSYSGSNYSYAYNDTEFYMEVDFVLGAN